MIRTRFFKKFKHYIVANVILQARARTFTSDLTCSAAKLSMKKIPIIFWHQLDPNAKSQPLKRKIRQISCFHRLIENKKLLSRTIL